MTDSPNGISALIEKKVQEARQEERKMIAEWLNLMMKQAGYAWTEHDVRFYAHQIERGEYRKGEGE